MTKEQLKQELQEKVKERQSLVGDQGIKPSHLKRSKSLGDIPAVPPLPSQQPSLNQLQSQLTATQEKLTNLQTSLGNQNPTLLRKAREELITLRQQLINLFPDSQLKPSELLAQLIVQKKELEQDWTNLAQNRVENLKVIPNPRIAELQQELAQTVKDASEEITRQENEIKQLKTKITQITNQNQDLVRQVNNYERAAELRITEPSLPSNSFTWWQDYAPIILLLGTYLLSAWLLSKNQPKKPYQ